MVETIMIRCPLGFEVVAENKKRSNMITREEMITNQDYLYRIGPLDQGVVILEIKRGNF